MASVVELADEFWNRLKQDEPLYAILDDELPASIPSIDETAVDDRSAHAADLLDRLRRITPTPQEADLAAVLEEQLSQHAAAIDELWHLHLVTPYRAHAGIVGYATDVVATRTGPDRRRLAADLVARVHSIAAHVRGQRERGIALPAPAVSGVRSTWQSMRSHVPTLLGQEGCADEAVAAFDAVLIEIEESARIAGDAVGVAHLPGGEQVYRSLVHHQTTLPVDPESLYDTGLERCAELTERMREIRSRLGGPADEITAREWLVSQPHLYASSPAEVASLYRRHVSRVETVIASLFRERPTAPYDVRRLDPTAEASMTFGYYAPPTPDEPTGLYRFNGSSLATRSQLTAAALILHELIPGHHFHVARQQENSALHPLQRHVLEFPAFNEGWGEYGSHLGWEAGVYDDDWDAYGRLAHERLMAHRLVVDTALNLGRWDLDTARASMRINTLEGEEQIRTELLRYATDWPAQGLAYYTGFLAFTEARAGATGADLRDVHEAMVGGGAVPMTRMRDRVAEALGATATVT